MTISFSLNHLFKLLLFFTFFSFHLAQPEIITINFDEISVAFIDPPSNTSVFYKLDLDISQLGIELTINVKSDKPVPMEIFLDITNHTGYSTHPNSDHYLVRAQGDFFNTSNLDLVANVILRKTASIYFSVELQEAANIEVVATWQPLERVNILGLLFAGLLLICFLVCLARCAKGIVTLLLKFFKWIGKGILKLCKHCRRKNRRPTPHHAYTVSNHHLDMFTLPIRNNAISPDWTPSQEDNRKRRIRSKIATIDRKSTRLNSSH